MAQRIESHELLEFRRLAAYVYATNKRWEQSVQLSKKDKMYKDAIDTSKRSESEELIEGLLRFFCEISEKECFSSCLYTCYEFVSPDVALELGWKNDYVDFIMPFMIQNLRDTSQRLKALESKVEEDEEEVADGVAGNYAGGMGYGNNVLMIGNGGMGGGQDMGYGGGGGGLDMGLNGGMGVGMGGGMGGGGGVQY